MSKSFLQLLSASKDDIEIIRRQSGGYQRPPLNAIQLETLRTYLNTLYPDCKVQTAFAFNIYMRAA